MFNCASEHGHMLYSNIIQPIAAIHILREMVADCLSVDGTVVACCSSYSCRQLTSKRADANCCRSVSQQTTPTLRNSFYPRTYNIRAPIASLYTETLCMQKQRRALQRIHHTVQYYTEKDMDLSRKQVYVLPVRVDLLSAAQ